MPSNDIDWDAPDPSQVAWDGSSGGHSFDLINGEPVPTGSPAALAAQSPTSGMLSTQLALAAAGKSQVDQWHGLKQLLGATPQEEIDDVKRRDQPLMDTMAGKLGYIGGNIADMAVLGGAGRLAAGIPGAAALTGIANPATYAGAVASGAVQGAIQPVATGDSRLWNTASGGAGGALGQGLTRGASAVGAALSDPAGRAANSMIAALNNAGVPLDAAQRTGSVLLQRAKAMLSDNPVTGGAMQAFQDMQQKSVTRGFLQTIGETANDASPSVMGRAASRMGKIYDESFEKLPVPYDRVEGPLSDLMTEAGTVLNPDQFGVINKSAQNILDKASENNGMIGGAQWQNIKTILDKVSGSGDQTVGSYAREMRGILNDGALQHAADTGNTAQAALLKQTNQQYGNMMKLSNPGVIVPRDDGSYQISPARVASVMAQKANRSISVFGRGDTSLSDLADASTAILGQKINNSGTPARIAAQAALGLGVGGAAGFNGPGEPYDWKKAAEYGAGAVVIPKLLTAGINAQGPVAQGAMRGLGALAEPTIAKTPLSAAAKAALQKLPSAALLGIEPGLDKSNKEQSAPQ